MGSAEAREQVRSVVADLAAGDAAAADRLLPLVYDELRALAGSFLKRERAGHTLQPTALVHEAWMRRVARPLGVTKTSPGFPGQACSPKK